MTNSGTNLAREYERITIATAADLRHIATSMQMLELSRLALPEIERLTDEVARIVPAGNVPGIILSGLARLNGRTVEHTESRRHIKMLFQGVRQSLDKAIFGAFFAGPAAILYGYQQLLRLAGKEIDAAFEGGAWQFYLEFALREDSARHANETTGFHSHLQANNIDLKDYDVLAAWMLAVVDFVRHYPAMLINEWRERVLLRTLAQVAEEFKVKHAETYADFYRLWEHQRPYHLPANTAARTFPAYRRALFDAFWQPHYKAMKREAREAFDVRYANLEATALPAYLQQMSCLAYLKPGAYSESREAYGLEHTLLAIICKGRYYLINYDHLPDVSTVRRIAGAILYHDSPHPPATLDDALVRAHRNNHNRLRRQLDDETQKDLEALKHAPIIINWDDHASQQPLASIRQAKRGIGDHPLTIIRTDSSFVFDQSHIFFDGAWGAAVAEIMTNYAASWASHLASEPAARRGRTAPYSPPLQTPKKVLKAASKSTIAPEAAAENSHVNLKGILSLRKSLKQRSDIVQITVNDILILYRSLHGTRYQPSSHLADALEKLRKSRSSKAQRAYEAVQLAIAESQTKNPAILIPIDASLHNPRERLFPTTFRNPLTDFWAYHRRAWAALHSLEEHEDDASRKNFEDARLNYLRMIAGFGELMVRYKSIALRGESVSSASIKFLANLPGAVQNLLNAVPERFDVLNEVIKGEEVFSNIGRVARGSSLRRFTTAKDDNAQKSFSWGVLTDDNGVMHLSLRDFRPHVALLYEAGHDELAPIIAQDYLDAYVSGLNQYVAELGQITVASSQDKKRRRRFFF